MKSGTVILSLLASTALAQPHKQVHRHKHEARDQVIHWVTEWAVETEIVAVTETVWVPEGYVQPSTTPSSASTRASTTRVPAQFFQPVSKSKSPSSSPSPTSTSVYVPPAPVPTPVEPVVAEAPPPPPKAPEPEPSSSSSSTTPAPVPSPEPVQAPAPEPKVEPVAPPPVQSSSAAAPEPESGAPGGECSKASPCTGDITHYDANAGIGACGWQSDGESENVVALSHLLMGTQSNGNPFCGKTITITLNGKSVTAKVVDKCMGCKRTSIDLSNHAFKELEDMGVGRTQASWYFN